VNQYKNPILLVMGLLALALFMVSGCSDSPEDPKPNVLPNTTISSTHINALPDSASFFTVTIYWFASDDDGQAEKYRYWIGAADVDDALKTETFETSYSTRLEFAEESDEYLFNVEARDNRGVWDETPATAVLRLQDSRRGVTFAPNTEGSTIPPNGALTSRGIHLVILGTDDDGFVPTMQWAVDDPSVWTNVVPQTILAGQSTLELDLLPATISTTGPHVIYVRSIDNYGNIDESPLAISIVAVDTLRPDLYVTSGAIPGAFYFLPQGGTTVDLTSSWNGDASWYYSTLQYRFAVDDSTEWSEWQSGTSATSTGLAAGAHTFYVQAMDLAGNTSVYMTNFGIGQLLGDRGILVVNGISWVDYSPQPDNMYAANGPFGTHPIDFWDLFDGTDYYPPNIEDQVIGQGLIPGDTLGHYSSVVMCMNAYNSIGTTDDAMFVTMLPLIMSYLNGGGNILLVTRYGANFITGDLLTYGLSEGNTLEFNSTNVNPSPGGLTAMVPGLVNIAGTGSWGATDLLAPLADPAITVLFNAPSVPSSVGGIIIQPEGKGKFVFIGGRPYRFDFVAMATDFDYILTHYFGE
jgi:hypothetical protein